MTRVLGTFLVGVSWIVLLTSALGALASGWLYYGYSNIDCNPMFARPEAACNMLTAWASEHVLITGRLFLPYRAFLIEEPDFLIRSAVSAVVTALLILVIHRLVRRRRKRRMGAFADVPGFRPIDGEGDV